MWKLQRPVWNVRDTFSLCISLVRVTDLKRRLESIAGDIVLAETHYLTAAQQGELHTILGSQGVNGVVTKKEMTKVYDQRMVHTKSPGRPVYDAIMLLAEHGRCPFCGLRTVSTLDHLLPKAHYSQLVVTPLNLVPSCSDCNKAKSDRKPRNAREVSFHPYFDDIENDRWLYARIVGYNPVVLEFFAQPSANWDIDTRAKCLTFFGLLGLDALYRSHSAEELVNINYRLTDLYTAGGEQAVREHLRDEAESRLRARPNSWQTAFYAAVSESDQFCNNGFGI